MSKKGEDLGNKYMKIIKDQFTVKPLDGTNYHQWRMDMEYLFRMCDLGEFMQKMGFNLEGANETDLLSNKAAMTLIVGKLEGKLRGQIIPLKTAHTMWMKLEKEYKKSEFEVVNLKSSFYKIVMTSTMTVRDLVNKLNDQKTLLSQVGVELEDSDMASQLLNGTEHKFRQKVEILRSLKGLRANDIAQQLIDLESRVNTANSRDDNETISTTETALVVKHVPHKKNEGTKFFDKSKIKCYNCGKKGHFKRDCRIKMEMNKNKNKMTEYSLNIRENIKCYEKAWLIDSGASTHISGNLEHFHEIQDIPTRTVVFGNDQVAEARKCGDVHISFEEGQKITIREVLYVEGMKANILSVSKLVNTGLTVNFTKDGCSLMNTDGRLLIGLKSTVEGLYSLTDVNSIKCMTVAARVTAYEMHKRLAHMSLTGMLKMGKCYGMQELTNISKDDEKEIRECKGCLQGKTHRKAMPKKRTSETSKVLELIHSDICGPMSVQSLNGSRYFITFIDDYSRYMI